MYSVKISKKAHKALSKMDKQIRNLLYAWMSKILSGCENPRALGKALKGDLNNRWRYRVGDYRIIADISDGELIILVVEVGHRREMYE